MSRADAVRPSSAARLLAAASSLAVALATATAASSPAVAPADATVAAAHPPGLAPEVVRALEASPYVYVATERKDGRFGTPAEIWFMWDDGAVWVASPPTTWRAKRIRAGRTKARIAVGSRSGPTLDATGSFVSDPAAYERLYATFAKKYPGGWSQYEARFREGLKDGSRVLIRYRPVAGAPATP